VAGPAPVDDAMLERLLTTVDRDRRVTRQRRWLAAAAAVVVLAGGSTVGPREQRCRLVAISDTGARDVAGSWEAAYDGTTLVSADVPRTF
jgi:hypothetical protein